MRSTAAPCTTALANRTSLQAAKRNRGLDLPARHRALDLTAPRTDSVALRKDLSLAPVAPVSESRRVVPIVALPASSVGSWRRL